MDRLLGSKYDATYTSAGCKRALGAGACLDLLVFFFLTRRERAGAVASLVGSLDGPPAELPVSRGVVAVSGAAL